MDTSDFASRGVSGRWPEDRTQFNSNDDSQENHDWFCPVVPRMQAQEAHFEFASGNSDLEWVLINIETMRRLVDKGKNADSVFGSETLVGVTSTVNDDILERWNPQREIAYVRRFKPTIYIPCDRPVYENDPVPLRQDTIKRYLNDLELIVCELHEHPVSIVPLVKGISPEERKRCYARFEKLSIQRYAYYCVQYFQEGNHRSELVRDIFSIANESEVTDILLIGLQARRTLSEMPTVVSAAAGQAWIEEAGLRNEKMTMGDKKDAFGEWKRTIEEVLEGGQTALSRWSGGQEVVYGD